MHTPTFTTARDDKLYRIDPPVGFMFFVYFDEFRYKNIEFPLYFCDLFPYNGIYIGERRFLVWAN